MARAAKLDSIALRTFANIERAALKLMMDTRATLGMTDLPLSIARAPDSLSCMMAQREQHAWHVQTNGPREAGC